MKINRNNIRLVSKTENGKRLTQPAGTMFSSAAASSSAGSSDARKKGLYAVQGRSLDFSIENAPKSGKTSGSSDDLKMQVAAEGLPSGTSMSNQGPRNLYAPLLDGYVYLDGSGDQQGNNITANSQLNNMYRDIYYSDPICGSAVDLMSNMPFSDFTLAGARDAKSLLPFEESIDNTKMRSLLPILSTEYLVLGLFCSTSMYNEDTNVYTGIIPQNVDYVQVTANPIFGQDPFITLTIGDAIKTLNKGTTDPRVAQVLEQLPEEYKNAKEGKEGFRPKIEDVLYITRGNLMRDIRGVSIFRRVVAPWLMEKAMYRGTLDQAFKRQRAIAHVTAGDEEWSPTLEEMQQLSQMLMAADLDPVGAVMVTRNSVNVNEIRSGDSFWKVSDLESFFTTAKLRALGISESFLSGESTFNSLEQVLSVYVEQMRAYREKVTQEVFYDRMFPRISMGHGFTNKRHGLNILTANAEQPGLFDKLDGFEETASEREQRNVRFKYRDQLMPQVHWHKRLRPEADQAYLEMLSTLSEKGIPIPVRLWAAAGGLDLKSLLNQRDEDEKIRQELTDWLKTIGKSAAAAMPPQEGFGGDMGGDDGGAELSKLTAGMIRKRALLDRDFGNTEHSSIRNVGGDGKRHNLSAKGSKVLEERMNRKIAEAAAETSRKVNALETQLEQTQRELAGFKTYSIPK